MPSASPAFKLRRTRKEFSPRMTRRRGRSGSRSGSRSAAAHHTPARMSLRSGRTYIANIARHLGKR